MYDTLQRLHPSKNYHDQVKQSDSIRKLLEILPVADRKWIKISDPAENTFWEVLKKILVYVDTETSLKLSIDDIEKEQKAKSDTVEVNTTQNIPGSNQSKNNQHSKIQVRLSLPTKVIMVVTRKISTLMQIKTATTVTLKATLFLSVEKNNGLRLTKNLRPVIKIIKVTQMTATLSTILIKTKTIMRTKI